MPKTRPEPHHVTQKRIWGVYYDLMEHFGIQHEDRFMSEYPLKRTCEEIVGVTLTMEFKSEADRDKVLKAFRTANNTDSANIQPAFIKGINMPHLIEIDTCGEGDELYFEMDRLTQSVAQRHLSAE